MRFPFALSPAIRSLAGVLLGTLYVLPTLSAQTPTLPTPTPIPPASAEKPEFRQLVPEGSAVEKIAGGFRFTEGPAWCPAGHQAGVMPTKGAAYLVFSDTPGNRIHLYDPNDSIVKPGHMQIYREPAAQPNGNFFDAAGNLYTCEHEGRRVAMLNAKGELETLVDRYDGKRFNSPNDIVVKCDGTVWFTDPTYGLGKRPKEQTANRVYCVDPKTREVRAVAEDFDQPNGLCFSPDETRLYVADSGKPRNVHVYDVSQDNRLANGRVFCTIDKGVPDGMRCDEHGNLFSTSDMGVQVFNPAGERLGVIPVPEVPANLCFGGADLKDLYITARTSLYRIELTTAGCAPMLNVQ